MNNYNLIGLPCKLASYFTLNMGHWGAQLSFSLIFQKQKLVDSLSRWRVVDQETTVAPTSAQSFLLAALRCQHVFSLGFGAAVPGFLTFLPLLHDTVTEQPPRANSGGVEGV